ncbi:MAG: S-methyl-5-thioribose-1-phosphate isomerase [Alcanivoracaceae bacterium]|nr:S-methyl-5-thioribose-1-phosphate isomerase [Alcanivoracaceae bacterium]
MTLIESPAIRWHGDHLELLDQRALPLATRWLRLDNANDSADAIRDMVVRGAPAIGITAAYAVVLAARALGVKASRETLQPAFAVLAASRPTAVNLFWALQRMQALCDIDGIELVDRLAAEAIQIHEDDRAMNHRLAAFGVPLLGEGKRVYTHCNTGALATGGHGTALGIIRTAWAAGRITGVVAGETRPWMQGARLTSWELLQENIPVTLVVDSAAGHVFKGGDIGAVIVGADRITANGDTANKIGTYNLAVLAKHHGIPFIVAAPLSTIDPALANGDAIEIEQRSAAEVRNIQGVPVAPENVPVFNPAFDVTPAQLISAIVTEHGVIERPDTDKMAAHLASAGNPR